ncbi:MAG: DUF3786 domain-containing protein [Elusimicrobiota bacterium]
MADTEPLKVQGYDKFWETILSRKNDDIAGSTGAVYDKEGNRFYIKFLGTNVCLTPSTRLITENHTEKVVEYDLRIAVLTYFALSKRINLSGEWVTPQQLPSGAMFFRGVHSIPAEKIIDRFVNDTKSVIAACEAIGGAKVEVSPADVCYDFMLFPRVPVRLQYWRGDEELPPSVTLLFDRTANEFLLIDGILGVAKMFVKRLTAFNG